jgi:hypothetical protein
MFWWFLVGPQARPGRLPDMINSQQRIRLVTECQRTGSIGMSALKSGMDRKTARKYLKHPERVGEPRPAREWRTRMDPLAAIWQEAEMVGTKASKFLLILLPPTVRKFFSV